MLTVTGRIDCPSATASSDPWIPLNVKWQVPLGGTLNLYITGSDGGYVELRVDLDAAPLHAMVVIDLPPKIEREIPTLPTESIHTTVVLDLDLWEWKVTPDYKDRLRWRELQGHCDERKFAVGGYAYLSITRGDLRMVMTEIEHPMATARVRWLGPEAGGRISGPPTVAVYTATMAFKLDSDDTPGWQLAADPFLSILVKRPEVQVNLGEELVTIGFLVSDLARPHLHPGAPFVIMEGLKVVAEAVVEHVIDQVNTEGS
jgi:hypothetical protein